MITPASANRAAAITTYLVALAAWIVAGVAPWLVSALLISAGVSNACDGATDCSWGFELLLVVPVLVLCLLWVGPHVVAGRIGFHGGDRARAERVARRAGIATIVLLYGGAGSGMPGFTRMLIATTFAVPAIAVWRSR